MLILAVAAVVSGGCGGGTSGDASAEADGGATVAESDEASSDLSARELVPLLTRYGVGPRGVGIDIIYAPPLFFEVTGLDRPAEMDSTPTFAFVLQETVHEGELPSKPPDVLLELEGGERVAPYDAKVTAEDPPHHRTTRVLFPQPDGWAVDAVGGEKTLRLVIPRGDDVGAGNIFEWRLPIAFGGGADGSGKD